MNKKYIYFIIIALLISAEFCIADWNIQLTSTGEVGTAPNIFTVTIGAGAAEELLAAPPLPPQYSTYIQLYEQDWVSGPYLSMLYTEGEVDTAVWLLELDPNGNIMPPSARTSTVSWPVDSLPAGEMYIINYYTGLPEVADMHTQNSFTVTSNEDRYFLFYWVKPENEVEHSTVVKSSNLYSVYPNPFNQRATLEFNLAEAGEISLKVFDISGREVQDLGFGIWDLGSHSVVWDAKDNASGVYFIQLAFNSGQKTEKQTQKVILMK